MAWLAYGDPELRFARGILDRDLLLRPGLVELYRRLRAGADVASALGEWPLAPARRLVMVLRELGLLDEQLAVRDGVARADLERSAAFVAARDRHRECVRWLSSATERRAA
jgi:single-stranded-DNA-specific exonuclease